MINHCIFKHSLKLLMAALVLIFNINRVEASTNNGSHRIREVYHNLSLPGKVYMIPTFASSILIPCVIEDVLIGQAEGFSYLVSRKSPKRLEINTTTEAETTNLIVYCSNKVFVFDLIIQAKTHNDVVILGGSFGGPEVEMQRSKYQDEFANSEKNSENKNEIVHPEIDSKGKDKELHEDTNKNTNELVVAKTEKKSVKNTPLNEVQIIPQVKQSNMKSHVIPHEIPHNVPSISVKEPLQSLNIRQEESNLASPVKSYLMTDKKAIELLRSAQLQKTDRNPIKNSVKSANVNLTQSPSLNPSRYFDPKLEATKSNDTKVGEK